MLNARIFKHAVECISNTIFTNQIIDSAACLLVEFVDEGSLHYLGLRRRASRGTGRSHAAGTRSLRRGVVMPILAAVAAITVAIFERRIVRRGNVHWVLFRGGGHLRLAFALGVGNRDYTAIGIGWAVRRAPWTITFGSHLCYGQRCQYKSRPRLYAQDAICCRDNVPQEVESANSKRVGVSHSPHCIQGANQEQICLSTIESESSRFEESATIVKR